MGVVVWDGKASVADLLDEADSRMYRDKHTVVRDRTRSRIEAFR
jgi:hypothetical protein